MANRVSRRLALIPLLVAFAVAAVAASVALAGGIRDEPCPNVAGEHTNTCPEATVDEPYSIRFRAVEEPPCAPGEDKWYIVSGGAPPGLSLNVDNGTLSGTPTAAGSYKFYVEMRLPDYWLPEEGRGCNGTADTSQKQFTINVKPGLPRLVIGPEQSGVPGATVGAAYSLAMTANLEDAKTWSIADGQLPPGTVLNAATGVISGTPTTAGTYVFTVRAALTDDRADTKTLAITVRAPLVLTFPELETRRGARVLWEVGVPFDADVLATGGSATYTWALTGQLPPGLTLGQDGSLSGRPLQAGIFPFAITVTDSEARVARFAGRLVVVARLTLGRAPLRLGVAGRLYRQKLVATGGVAPRAWRMVSGPLPRGVRLDRRLGVLAGVPRKAGRYRVRVQVADALGVRSTKTYLIRVAPAPKPKR